MRYVDPATVVSKHLQGHPAPSWKIAIMCFHSKAKTELLARYFRGQLLGYRVFSKCDETVVYEAKISGETIGILGWCTGGGPMVASIIEELAALEVKYVIGIGAAASITHNILIQDVVLPIELLVNDGTSRYYVGEKSNIYIQPEMYTLFQLVQKEVRFNVKEVKAATVEALYRQDAAMLQPWINQGCEIVNWELTPFYAVSKSCGIKCIWYGHISDMEVNGNWNDWYCDRISSFMDSLCLCKKTILHLTERKL